MIRAIRQALGMTQAEFGHALGWAPSTISRWEAGRGQPNRLAVKIILAFAEERRVRYRPRRELALRPPAMALPIPALPIPAASRPAVTVLPPAAPDGGWAVSAAATRPRWEAELNFRIALDRHVTVILSQSDDDERPLCGVYFNLHSPYRKPAAQKAT